MCGRFNLFTSVEMIMDDINVEKVLFEPSPRYNISPGQTVAAVYEDDGRVLDGLRWGLIPPWSKDGSEGNRMINARSEGLFEKPMFRSAIVKKRCVLPANGFFEWRTADGVKVPHYIKRKDSALLYLGGIYEDWRSADGAEVRSCSIITMPSSGVASSIHDRMPLIFGSQEAVGFIHKAMEDKEGIASFFKPLSIELETYKVSSDVNSPISDGEHLVKPLKEWF